MFAVPLQLRTPAQRARLRELISAYSQARRRKRKKSWKRRTPRTSSLPGRARRRQRQWSACNAGFTGYDAPRVMFPFGVARPKMLRILASMDQKDRCSGIYIAGIACDNAPRAVFSSLVRRPFPGPHFPDSAESCGVHTGAVLGRGCDHARCWATTRPHGTDSSETRGVPTGAVVSPVDPHGLALLKDHRDSAVAECSWWSLFCCAGRACSARCLQRYVPMVQTLHKFVEVPQSQFLPVVDVAVLCSDKLSRDSEGATDSVHCRSQWTFQSPQRQLRTVAAVHGGPGGGDEGYFAAGLQHFSASVLGRC